MIKIGYQLALTPHAASEASVISKMQQARQAALDLPLMQVGEVTIDRLFLKPFIFGGKPFIPQMRIGFKCGFENSPKLGIYLMKFPEVERCPRYWYYEDEFWTIARAPDDEFLRRHRTTIKLLEILQDMEFTVQVRDEGGFWESHNSSALLEFKHRMDEIKDPREAIKNQAQ